MSRILRYETGSDVPNILMMDTPEELKNATLVDPFSFTMDVPVLQIPARKNLKGQPSGLAFEGGFFEDTKTVLYDLLKIQVNRLAQCTDKPEIK